MGELLDELEGLDSLDDIQTANVRLARESYDKATRLPTEFVSELAKHNSKSLISWTEARRNNDFSIFRDDLAKSIDLARKKADYLGYEDLRYDALLDIYESGLTVSRLDPFFEGLRNKVAPLIRSVAERERDPIFHGSLKIHGSKWVRKDLVRRFLSRLVSISRQVEGMPRHILSVEVQIRMMLDGPRDIARLIRLVHYTALCMRLAMVHTSKEGEILTFNPLGRPMDWEFMRVRADSGRIKSVVH